MLCVRRSSRVLSSSAAGHITEWFSVAGVNEPGFLTPLTSSFCSAVLNLFKNEFEVF